MTRKFTVRFFFNILALTCLIAGVGCNEFASNNDVLLNFVNESEGYELEYPVGWVAFELLVGQIQASSKSFYFYFDTLEQAF